MIQYNCLSPGDTITSLVRQNHPLGIDIRFCRSTDEDTQTTDDIREAEFGTVYLIADFGEAIAIHDFDFTLEGAAEASTCVAEIMAAINEWMRSFDV